MMQISFTHSAQFVRSLCSASSLSRRANITYHSLFCSHQNYHRNRMILSQAPLIRFKGSNTHKIGLFVKHVSTNQRSIQQTSSFSTRTKRFQTSVAPTIKNSSKLQNNRWSSFLERVNAVLLTARYIHIPRWISPRKYSFNLSECFGHFSFVLVAASYATDDFTLLRVIAVAGSSFMMVFTYFHPHGRVLWLPLKWNALFILINSYRIGSIMYLQAIGSRLSTDLKRIKHDHFDAMELSDYVKLVSIATEETFEDGKLVCYQGQKNRFIRMVIEGNLVVLRDGVHTYSLDEGNFVSEAGLHAGLLLSGEIESCCAIIAQPKLSNDSSTSTRVLRWDRSELMVLLNKESGLRRALSAALSWDIVRKLKGQRQYISEQVVSDTESWTRKRNEQNEDRYASILQNVLQYPDVFGERREELNKYRIIHQIDDEHHKLALEKCGWTVEEYKAGKRNILKQ